MKAKVCSRCGKRKPLSAYNRRSCAPDKLSYSCRECTREMGRNHYSKNPKKVSKWARDRVRALASWMRELKESLECPCGERHPACLEFHHKDPKKKDISVSMAIRYGWSKERTLKEIRKCVVLCSNCHRKLHYENLRTLAARQRSSPAVTRGSRSSHEKVLRRDTAFARLPQMACLP